MNKFYHNIGFWENRQFFCRKLAKIAENCDHNIDPRYQGVYFVFYVWFSIAVSNLPRRKKIRWSLKWLVLSVVIVNRTGHGVYIE
jgi:hypothetical protein